MFLYIYFILQKHLSISHPVYFIFCCLQLVGQFLKWEFVQLGNWDPPRYRLELFVMESPQPCGTLRTKTMRMCSWIDVIPKQHLKEQNLQATCLLFTKASSLRRLSFQEEIVYGRLFLNMCPWSLHYKTIHISGISGEFSYWWEFWCGEG